MQFLTVRFIVPLQENILKMLNFNLGTVFTFYTAAIREVDVLWCSEVKLFLD